tara:strand:- start:3 stop:1274 length:1272 start_codon:yes stop_codon:yes gene_type:complete
MVFLEVKKVLEKFNEKNIVYALLRNYESLALGKYSDKDLDILLDRQSLDFVKQVLKDLGYYYDKVHSFENQLLFVKMVEGELFIIDIKVSGLSYYGINYYSSEMLTKRKKNDFYYHLSKEDEFISLFLHCMIDKGEFKKSYVSKLKELSSNKIDYIVISNDLLKNFGSKSKAIFENLKNYDMALKNRKSILMQLVFKNIFNFFKLVMKAKIIPLLNILNPFKYGSTCAFIGTDGSGKTTTCKKLMETFSKNGYKVKYVYMGWNDNIIPVKFLSKLFHKANKTTVKEHEVTSKGSSFKSRLLFFLADIFVFVEMYLRYIFKVFWRLKLGYVVFFDRYIYDRLVLGNSSIFTHWLYMTFFPKPSNLFFLYNDVNTLFERKHEISKDEISKQLINFDNLKLDKIKIKSDKIELTLEKVFAKIYNCF